MQLGDRMKMYEEQTDVRFLPMLPVIARLDGRGFSRFTKGLNRPYDERLHNIMVEVTKHLVAETHADCGYTQSDEITLAWYHPQFESQVFFGGRILKLTSTLAAMATQMFNELLPGNIPEKAGKRPTLDCRVFQVPNLSEACNAFLWREQDATKNSITMAAQEYYSHTELDGKNGSERQEMLFQKGINWNDYPNWFKRGSYIQRVLVLKQLDEAILAKMPEHVRAEAAGKTYTRSEVVELNLPPLSQIENKICVLFPKVCDDLKNAVKTVVDAVKEKEI